MILYSHESGEVTGQNDAGGDGDVEEGFWW